MTQRIKNFNGKIYRRREYLYELKEDAQKSAESFRNTKRLVRIIKDKRGWYCYVHTPKYLRI